MILPVRLHRDSPWDSYVVKWLFCLMPLERFSCRTTSLHADYRKNACLSGLSKALCGFRPEGNTSFFSVTPTNVASTNWGKASIIKKNIPDIWFILKMKEAQSYREEWAPCLPFFVFLSLENHLPHSIIRCPHHNAAIINRREIGQPRCRCSHPWNIPPVIVEGAW